MSPPSPTSPESKETLGFLDSLARIFRGRDEEDGPEPARESGDMRLETLGASFESAVGELQEKVEALRARSSGPPGAARATRRGAKREDPEAARQRRIVETHLRIRGDIEQMHAQLGTGLNGDDLDEITAELEELELLVSGGRNSHELIPRVRHAIGERLRTESGKLAVERLRALLERAAMPWPDPTHYRPSATEEEVERSRRRRLAETREVFLGQGFLRTAERAVGIVSGWGSDYPDADTPLWQECVLQGVAAGIRGQLARAFLEVLRRDRELVIASVEELIGKEVAELRRALGDGVSSIPDANRVVAGALQAIDVVVPEAAWKHVCEQEPRARGEWND
jgi:hypothetical protein